MIAWRTLRETKSHSRLTSPSPITVRDMWANRLLRSARALFQILGVASEDRNMEGTQDRVLPTHMPEKPFLPQRSCHASDYGHERMTAPSIYATCFVISSYGSCVCTSYGLRGRLRRDGATDQQCHACERDKMTPYGLCASHFLYE